MISLKKTWNFFCQVCLEMLSFANYSGDADSKIVREIWARLLDQALTKGGVAEACSVVKRVGSKLDPADGACLPLDIICLHLEKAALVMCIFCIFHTCILETNCESIPQWYSYYPALIYRID